MEIKLSIPSNYGLNLTARLFLAERQLLCRDVSWAFRMSEEIMISRCRFRVALLSAVIAVAGSACAMHAAMDDLMNNKYLAKKPYDNPGAAYVGTWSANMPGTILCYRIYPSGIAKYCQNNWGGTTEKGYAKVYKEEEAFYLISESGTTFRIDAYGNDYIKATAYGKSYVFIPGVKSYACEEFLSN